MKCAQMVQVFSIPSSSENRQYDIQVISSPGEVRLVCNCQAGQFGKLCKHALHLLRIALGQESDDIDIMHGDLSEIAAHVASSEVPSLVRQLDESERNLEDAKKLVFRAKRDLERRLVQGA